MRTPLLLLVVALVLAGCGDDTADPTTTTAPGSSTAAPTTQATTEPATDTTAADGTESAEVDLITYVAAIEDALAGTAYEGEALEAPEVFLATGSLFCDQLDAGMTPDEVLTTYVETLTGGPIDEASDDDLVMAGGVLGVGVVTLCERHLDAVATTP